MSKSAHLTLADKVYQLDYDFAHRERFTPFVFRFINSSIYYIYFFDKLLPNGDNPYLCMSCGRYVVIDEFTAQTEEILFIGLWK